MTPPHRGCHLTLVGLIVAVAALAACGSGTNPTPGPTVAPTASILPATDRPAFPDSPLVGVVTSVDSSGLASVSGFTLRTGDGRTFEIRIGTLENGAEFPPGHLSEHIATAEPVKVSFRVDGTELVAYRIEDAGG